MATIKVDIPTAFHYFVPVDPADEKKGETRVDRGAGLGIEVDAELARIWIAKGIAAEHVTAPEADAHTGHGQG